jgi:hypothetical protein
MSMNNPNPDYSCTHTLLVGGLACALPYAVPTGSRPRPRAASTLLASSHRHDRLRTGSIHKQSRASLRCFKLAAFAAKQPNVLPRLWRYG